MYERENIRCLQLPWPSPSCEYFVEQCKPPCGRSNCLFWQSWPRHQFECQPRSRHLSLPARSSPEETPRTLSWRISRYTYALNRWTKTLFCITSDTFYAFATALMTYLQMSHSINGLGHDTIGQVHLVCLFGVYSRSKKCKNLARKTHHLRDFLGVGRTQLHLMLLHQHKWNKKASRKVN